MQFPLPTLKRCEEILCLFVAVSISFFAASGLRAQPFQPDEPASNADLSRAVTPVNQVLTPAGIQVELPSMRPQVLALSPDGRILVTSGKTSELVAVDPVTGNTLARIPFPSDKTTEPQPDRVSDHILDPDKDGQVSYTGLLFSPDGRRIYLSNVNGNIKVFRVGVDHQIAPNFTIPLAHANQGKRTNDIPAGLAISKDGKRLYVALNMSNRLLELDAQNGKQLRLFDVGVAPYGVELSGNKIYVSNWGGRRPDTNSLVGPAGHGTTVRVDSNRHIANEGSVTVINLATGQTIGDIMVGLHASAMTLSPNGKYLLVANPNSDSVSVIDVRTDTVVQTISLKWKPKDYFGASPNALAFEPKGETLYVCNSTQNAIAVVRFSPKKSELLGLIPTGWFPGAIVYDSHHVMLYVANIKGFGSGKLLRNTAHQRLGSGQHFGSLSLIQVPNHKQLINHTRRVLSNYRREVVEASQLPPRRNQPARPVPERVGEPSVFKHVIYIIKENRTYDQVLGDMKEGNGDLRLCIFGEDITPNQHKICKDFVLLDNTYCSGVLSADGHQWADAGLVTDYLEKSFAGFPRSYPDGMEDADVDAIAYSSAGFIWDNAIEHGKTMRTYGEFAITESWWKDRSIKRSPKFMDYYKDFKDQTGLLEIWSRPAIGSLANHICTNTVGWDMKIPDVFRAAQFIKELKEFEAKGDCPNLMLICLPNDHTSGTSSGSPTPAASVADNDLAFGQILEAVSKSRFWKDTCVIAMEDDPQGGWDHVSGYRTTTYLASAYTKRGQVIHTHYNQPGILRTIELILGLPPMNQFDASATPMSNCFNEAPDFTPFVAVPNSVPLDQLNPDKKTVRNPVQLYYATLSDRLPLEKVDACPEDTLNRILWYAQTGNKRSYPTWALLPKAWRIDRD